MLGYCLLAEVGHPEPALEGALTLPLDVFKSAGGNGHSLSNTLWYISTRPTVQNPLDLSDFKPVVPSPVAPPKVKGVIDCGLPKTCTWEVLDANANGFSCKSRMNWLMTNMKKTELEACHQISGIEYATSCGGCDPNPEPISNTTTPLPIQNPDGDCPHCSREICDDNRCPLDGTWYLCTEGAAKHGCAIVPWKHAGVISSACMECCTLTPHCGEKR